MSYDVLKDLNIEISTKYLYLALLNIKSIKFNFLEISCEELCNSLGISPARMYRARGNLVKLGLIKFSKKFCPDTGKRSLDVYEII